MSKIFTFLLTLLLMSNSSIIAQYYNDLSDSLTERQLTITFVGDIMVHDTQYLAARVADGSYDFKPCFQYVKENFQSADLMVGNLETTLTSENNYSGYPVFRTPAELATALKDAGFDIVGTANNHSLDNRLYGVETTLSLLKSVGIASTGTYRHDEPAQPLVVEKDGFKLGFIASTYGTNGFTAPPEYNHIVNLNDIALYQQQIEQLDAADVDAIIAIVHWGSEYQRQANEAQIEFAKQLTALGVDIIIGSHPHVIQPDDWLTVGDKNCYVVYSLGNFVSAQYWRYTDTGLALSLTLDKSANRPLTISEIEYSPFWVDRHDENGNNSFAVIPLRNAPQLTRLSAADQQKMQQALDDFMTLYQINDFKRIIEH